MTPLGTVRGISRCSVRFLPVFLRKTVLFSGQLSSGRPKTAGKFSPPVLSVHLSFSSRGHRSRRVQPYGCTGFVFHHFPQNSVRFFGTSLAFPGFPLSAAGCPTRNPPTHCMICPFLPSEAAAGSKSAANFIPAARTAPAVFLVFVGLFPGATAPDVGNFPGGPFGLPCRFYGKKLAFQLPFTKIVFVRRTPFSPSPLCFCCHVPCYIRKPPVFLFTEFFVDKSFTLHTTICLRWSDRFFPHSVADNYFVLQALPIRPSRTILWYFFSLNPKIALFDRILAVF